MLLQVAGDVNFEELARSTDDFNAAQLKAVCVEAGMLALRRDGTEVRGASIVCFMFSSMLQLTFMCACLWGGQFGGSGAVSKVRVSC